MAIDTDEFLSFCRSLEGESLLTMYRRAPFTVQVIGDGLVYVPVSTGKPRSHERAYLGRVLRHFDQTGSWRPKDYMPITFCASYTLAVLRLYVDFSRSP